MRRAPSLLFPAFAILSLLLSLLAFPALASPVAAPATEWPVHVFMPFAVRATDPPPGPTPLPARIWDPRLDQLPTEIIPANVQPGQGYWRITRGQWYGPYDTFPFGVGDHDVAVDVRGGNGERLPGVRFRWISYWDGSVFDEKVTTAMDDRYTYATTFQMYNRVPSYRVEMVTGDPAEGVTGLGMGTPDNPWYKEHASYGFVWEWVDGGQR